MGGLSLTNPGLVSQDQTIDPLTGQPVVKPRVQFFPNNLARLRAFSQNNASQVQPSTSTVDGQINAPLVVGSQAQPDQNGKVQPSLSTVEGSIDGAPTTGTIQPPNPVAPKLFKPSFSSTLTDPSTGLPAPINAAQTKLGKLLTILGSAARGAASGWGYMNAAQGAAAAREIPFQEAQQRASLAQQQAQTALTQSQASMVPTPYGPMPLGMARYIFPSLINAGAKRDVANIGANSREDVAQINQGMALPVPETVANLAGFHELANVPAGKATWANINAAIRARGYQMKDLGDEGMWLLDRQGNRIQRVGDSAGMAAFLPTVKSETSTTDLMGNTSSQTTTQKQRPRTAAAPGVASTGGLAPAAGPVPLVQNVPGGPLVSQNPAASAQPRAGVTNAVPAGTAAPRTAAQGAAPAAKTNTATTPVSQLTLPDDVEQRLTTAGLNQQQQDYVRGLLNYRGRLPASGGRSASQYAQTIALLTKLDPSFDETNYQARQQLQTRFISGDYADQRLAFNTAIQHLGQLNEAAALLDNGQYTLLNRIANRYNVAVGKSPAVTFNNIRDAVAGELSKVYKGTVTEGELNRVGGNISSDMAPGQIAGATTAAIGLMGSKMRELANIYETGMRRPVPFTMTSPDAAHTLSRLAGATHEVLGKDGKTPIGYVKDNQYVAFQ